MKNYWISNETNIFRDSRDALFSLLVLVALPALSIFYLIFTDGYGFWEYGFPQLSIALTGLVDSIARFDENRARNPKLVTRIVLDFIAILFSMGFMHCENYIIRLIPAAVLVLLGIALLYEIYSNVVTSIKISKWYPGN